MLLVGDLMTRSPLTLTAGGALSAALRALTDAGVTGAPVCDAQGRVVGMLSMCDVISRLDGTALPETVGDLMSVEVLTALPEEPVAVAIKRMVFEGVHRLVVLDAESHLDGVVAAGDVLRAIAEGRIALVAGDPPASVRATELLGDRSGPGTPGSSSDH